ncbi:MAG: putative zinc-binding protein [Candidatus Marinimicrobia bacterium]|nr:putative zinc-binding protein [Candidatus Neomarinimicrobiota bacterium]
MTANNKKITVVACSGASNTGAYSDKVAQKLMALVKTYMLCLAKFAVDKNFAEISKKKLEELGEESELIVIDGCPVNCAEKILKASGFTNYKHINTTDYGIVKGKTPSRKIKQMRSFMRF